jgi:hypothetical protein
MRTIPTLATTTLDDRAACARAWTGGWIVVGERGGITILDRALGAIGRHEPAARPTDAALDPTGALLIVAHADGLRAIDAATGALRWSQAGAFRACLAAGTTVWTAEHRDTAIVIARRDLATGAVLRAIPIPDPFGEAAVSLRAHPVADRVIAWIAAGQDGQLALLITEADGALAAVELGARDRLPPVFTPAGDAYLSAGDDDLAYVAWPSGDELDGLGWADDDDGGDPFDDRPRGDVLYLPGGYATWASDHGRLYLIDLAGMAVIDELVLAGHPLRALADSGAGLEEGAPATDLRSATPGPDGLVLTVHGDHALVVSRLADWSADPAR